MKVRKLKHTEAYFKRLHTFASAMGIIVISDIDVDGEGQWIPTRNKIKIDQDLADSQLIATFLHELGHALDDITFNDPKHEERLGKAYYAVYQNTAKKTQTKLVVECEKRAWQKGRIIAKKLRIKLGKWYDEEEADCLAAYKKKD